MESPDFYRAVLLGLEERPKEAPSSLSKTLDKRRTCNGVLEIAPEK